MPNLDLLCFSQATDSRFKRFFTVLKTRIRLEGSRLEGSRLEDSRDEKGIQQSDARELEGKEIFKLFADSGNLVNLAKSIIYTTLQAETLILTCPPFPLFSCQLFRPRGHLLRLIHM